MHCLKMLVNIASIQAVDAIYQLQHNVYDSSAVFM